MKKKYVNPATVSVATIEQSALLEHSYGWVHSKKQDFFDEEADAQDEVAPTDKSVWDDEKNWD